MDIPDMGKVQLLKVRRHVVASKVFPLVYEQGRGSASASEQNYYGRFVREGMLVALGILAFRILAEHLITLQRWHISHSKTSVGSITGLFAYM